MCYPKPGPRCSAHAKARYIKLRLEHKEIMDKKHPSWEDFNAMETELENAKLDFDSTPVGQAILERRIRQGEDFGNTYAERLEKVRELRRLQLAAIKSDDKGDIHNHGDNGVIIAGENLQGSRKHRKNLNKSSRGKKKLKEYLDYSQNLSQKLTTEESDALYWHTSDGSGVVNQLLHRKYKHEDGKWSYEKAKREWVPSSQYSAKMINTQIKTLDGVFARHSLPEPVVLYRGIGKNNFPDELKYAEPDSPEMKEYLEEKYPVGKEITIHEYMSTSLDPSIAHRFAGYGNPTVIEVKTKKAVPVAMMSAWDASEREFVVNRGGKYKVVAVLNKVVYEDVFIKNRKEGTHDKNVTVIQLEEI